MTNDAIQRRVAEPHGKAAQEVSIKVESPAAEPEEARSNASAAVSGTMGKQNFSDLAVTAQQLETLTGGDLQLSKAPIGGITLTKSAAKLL
jgi:hypothetical protein